MSMYGAPPPPLLQNPGASEDYCLGRILLHSPGLWPAEVNPENFHFFTYSLPRMLAQIALIFSLTQALYLLLKRFRLPRLVCELLAGIILGPTVLGRFEFIKLYLLIEPTDGYIILLSKFGYMFFMFLSGVKMDAGLMSRTGVKAWTIGALAVAIPNFGFTVFSDVMLPEYSQIHRYRRSAISTILRVTSQFSFPVIAALLVDLKIMNSELGRLSMATALIADLGSNVYLSVYTNLKLGAMAAMDVLSIHACILSVACMSLIAFTCRPLSAMIIKRTPEGKPVDTAYIVLFAYLVFLAAVLTDNAGMSFQYGPFILGLAVPDGPPLGSTLVDKMDTMVSGLLAPLMVTYTGMKVNLNELYDLEFIVYVWITVLSCYAFKYFSVFTPALACGVTIKDAASLAFILGTQGIMQVALYLNTYVNQTLDRDTFSMLVVSVLIIATASHLVVAYMYDYSRAYSGYQKRDIQHNSGNSELRLLTVAHRLDDVLAARKLLDLSYPYRESPLSIYSLFLVELVGRATPLLIDHQLGQKNASTNSRSQKMVDVLHAFELQYMGCSFVQFFTSVSLQKFMHHDICTLAYDKLTSMIILPFHRKWNQQGKLTQDNKSIRLMNNNVLETAPCSVAILIDRQKAKSQAQKPSPMQHVSVIFLGGADDREALSYARRMSRSPTVYLTVVRFVPWDPELSDNQWDAVLDAELLKDTRFQAQQQDNIVYREERVKDGAESALLIHDMEEAFDLILLGRRHRNDMPQLIGLNEWNDIPELGPLGDLFAVGDIASPVSVVVVQQQNTKTK
ncbi:PREDICTED: cation/H(+) antiporter 3-like [Ipomoea nil]|uniref:cation/H(+) antiporter 3-like n=1 Tax=Ipomoea nil TaxID=35883 RepID=UPI0009010BDF|nr:PREDICTED: cation/H(+) antiporter 3-like [Ipomoea nil]XP_019149672.1 PREDICTED: cation/H(+) antiporter 3-like [Ipomoea nil]